MPTAPEQVNNSSNNKHFQLRVPHQGAAPQAANQKATLLEWEVYSPTPVNSAFYKLGLQPLTSHFSGKRLEKLQIGQNWPF